MALCIACALVVPSAAGQSGNCTQKDSSTRPDCPRALAFFLNFRSALENNDRQRVASLISYPVLAQLHKKRTFIRSRGQLIFHFDEVFDQQIRCAILSATDKDVWGNSRGFTVDGGPIWFDGIIPADEHPDTDAPDYWSRYPIKIITINNGSHYECHRSRPGEATENSGDLSQIPLAIKNLRKLQPDIQWNEKSAVIADVNCDGKRESIVVGKQKSDVVVAIVSGQRQDKSDLMSFPIDSATQNGFCGVPVSIEISPLDCASNGDALPGSKPVQGCQQFSVVDDECDPFNFYWDSAHKRLAWWRN